MFKIIPQMAADFVEQSENFNNYNSFIYNNFRIFATSFLCLLRRDTEIRFILVQFSIFPIFRGFSVHNAARSLALAASTSSVRMERRYIWVVVSDVCPNASLMTETGMSLSLAAVAHEWRAT